MLLGGSSTKIHSTRERENLTSCLLTQNKHLFIVPQFYLQMNQMNVSLTSREIPSHLIYPESLLLPSQERNIGSSTESDESRPLSQIWLMFSLILSSPPFNLSSLNVSWGFSTKFYLSYLIRVTWPTHPVVLHSIHLTVLAEGNMSPQNWYSITCIAVTIFGLKLRLACFNYHFLFPILF